MWRWIEGAAALLLALTAAAGLWFVYHLYAKPAELRVAVGPAGGDEVALLTALARRSADGKLPVRLAILPTDGPVAAARLIDAGKADLAVIRADLPVPGAARALVQLHKSAVIIVAPKKSRGIEKFGDLKKRTLGVVGPPGANDRLVEQLMTHYGLGPSDLSRVPLSRDDVAEAVQKGRVDAVLTTGPLTGATIGRFNAAVSRAVRGVPMFVAIDAEAIAKSAPQYEAEDIPAGTFRASPAIPADEVSTLFFPNLLVARSKVPDEQAAAVVRFIFDARGSLEAEYPGARLIESASTDKDAVVPVHPGAAAYYGDTEKSFFDRYGDALFYGSMLVSLGGTLAAGAFRRLSRPRRFPVAERLTRLRQMAREAAVVGPDQLTALRGELDGMFDELVDHLAQQTVSDTEAATLLMVIRHVGDALPDRRRALAP
jgi:TRAP transporter TAXI family solute receptor